MYLRSSSQPVSLLVAAGINIKIVSERLGHAHPGFTMATYQHVMPGMDEDAALDYANLIHPHDTHPTTGHHQHHTDSDR